MDTDWVLVATYDLAIEAEVAASYLLSCGVEARVFQAHSNRMMPHLAIAIPAELRVRAEDRHKALHHLAEAQPLREGEDPEPGE
jgi:hypothetical protein